MSNQKQIAEVRAEIKKKERQLYRANKETNAWSKAGARSHFNANAFKLSIESQQNEVSELREQLAKLEKEEK